MSSIAKSGWLYRQSSVLRRWKRSWVELHQNGYLKYFENETSQDAEDVIIMPTQCSSIKTGRLVDVNSPPPGYSADWLFSVHTAGSKTWVFCGESLDDMKAWHMALEQARLLTYTPGATVFNPGVAPPPYIGPSYPLYGGTSVAYVNPPMSGNYYGYQAYPGAYPGQTTVIYRNAGHRYGGGGGNLAMGMLAGAAVGSMLWAPLLWC